MAGDVTRVWYTGYNQREQAGRLMLARGPDVHRLAKAGVMIPSHPPRYGNPKEATVVARGEGWRLFFEFARGGASLIGQVDSDDLDGGWSEPADASLTPRPGSWDGWHLSAGPVIGEGSDRPIMFYNGATEDAHWRIGWAAFDKDFGTVKGAQRRPAGPARGSGDGSTDIAFAASAIETEDGILLYYSQSDQHLRRVTIRRT